MAPEAIQTKLTLSGAPPQLLAELRGSWDGSEDFRVLLGTADALQRSGIRSVRISLRLLERLNSAATRRWMEYFSELSEQGLRLSWVECSPCVVEKLNLFTNFHCNGEVESIQVPYLCQPCGQEFEVTAEALELAVELPSIPAASCPICKKRAQFDEEPAEYFRFLRERSG